MDLMMNCKATYSLKLLEFSRKNLIHLCWKMLKTLKVTMVVKLLKL